MNEVWVSEATVLAIHDQMLMRFGGGPGIRDRGLLESALAQPLQSYGGEDLYPRLTDKAARLAFGMIRNHPFVDGNKRVGAALLGAVLRVNGWDLPVAKGALADAVLEVASGSWGFEARSEWVAAHAVAGAVSD